MPNQQYVHATTISISDSSSGSFDLIGGIEGDIPYPELDSELLDITARDSPNNRRQWGSGLEDSPELMFTVFWDPESAQHTELISAQRTKAEKWFEFQAPNFDPWIVQCVVRRFAPTSPSGGYMRAQVTLKPTGDIDTGNGGNGGGGGGEE